jgi:hypothetical protein
MLDGRRGWGLKLGCAVGETELRERTEPVANMAQER